MSVTITALEAENVKRIKAVALTPAPTGLTLVGGNNNQGKTSVLDALAWALGGDRFRPNAAQRDGAVAPAHLKVTLSNGVIVERKGKNPAATSFSIIAALVAGVPRPFRSASSGISSLPAFSIADRRVSSDTFCQGCLRTFFAVIQNQTLDFVAHGFFARFTEMDFDAVGGLSDFLYHYRWRGFLYGQRGSCCGGAAVAGVVVHRLSFP